VADSVADKNLLLGLKTIELGVDLYITVLSFREYTLIDLGPVENGRLTLVNDF
jgi:hypothetical protein